MVIFLLPVFGISEKWSFFLPENWVNIWDKKFEKHNGWGIGVSTLLVFTPEWWNGSYIKLWPGYTRFVSGELEGDGSGNLDVTVGCNITPKLIWYTTFQKNYDVDFRTYRRGRDTGLKNDWNVFAAVQAYF